jgi:hypothetical protein
MNMLGFFFFLSILLHLNFTHFLLACSLTYLHHPYSICVDTNSALHYYSHDNAGTSGGMLNISTEQKINNYKAFDEKKKEYYADKKYIQSAMLQSWNKFCFVGGIVEFSAKLPGDPRTGGLWPARESSFALCFCYRRVLCYSCSRVALCVCVLLFPTVT